MKRVLVISPHPDDESIGCGGTLRKHVLQGDTVRVVFLTSGEKGGHGRSPQTTRRLREAEAKKAASIIGLSNVEFWGGQDGALRVTTALVDHLQATLNTWSPHLLYVTHPAEMHPDHRASVRLVQHAFHGRHAPDTANIAVLMFEVWTPLQQLDDIVDITPYIKTKLAAIRAYKTQCAVVGFDDAALGLNRYRGELHSWPHGQYAEVFARLQLKANNTRPRAKLKTNRP